MSNLINPEDLIRAAEPGAMVYAVGAIDGARMVSLFIREDVIRIAALSNPLIELHAGVFAERHSVLVAVMAQINQELYESWWNYHQPDSLLLGSRPRVESLNPQSPHQFLRAGDSVHRQASRLGNDRLRQRPRTHLWPLPQCQETLARPQIAKQTPPCAITSRMAASRAVCPPHRPEGPPAFHLTHTVIVPIIALMSIPTRHFQQSALQSQQQNGTRKV